MERAREIREGLMCSICNNFLRDSYNLPCGHTFCLECINDALADKNSCPTCMNPAWQKDILKTALADSAVQDWVSHCEAKFLAHSARQAERGGDEDDEDTETDSALSDASSGDDHADTDVDEEEEEEEEKKQVPSIPKSAAAFQQQPAAPQAPKNAGMAPATREGASEFFAGRGLKGAISTHDSRNNGAAAAGGEGGIGGGAASLSDPKPAAVEDRHSAAGGQEKENFAALRARPASAAAASADKPATAAPSPRVVGVGRAAAATTTWGLSSSPPPSDKNRAPRVRFQPSPQRARGSEADPCVEGAFGEGPNPSSPRNQLPTSPTIAMKAGGAPSLVVRGTADAQEAAVGVEKERRERETPEAPRLEGGVGRSSVASPPGVPRAELERQALTPPRRIPEKACEDAPSTPQPSPARRKGVAAVRGQEEASGFALALPDTCDILDADSPPPQSPIATANTILLTPPTFKAGRAGSSSSAAAAAAATTAAAGCGMDAAGAAACPAVRVGSDSGGEGNGKLPGVGGGTLSRVSVAEECGRDDRHQLSPQSRAGEELQRGLPNPTSKADAGSCPAAEGEDVPAEKCAGGVGKRLVGEHQDTAVEGSVGNGEVRDGSSRLPPADRATTDVGHDSPGCPAEGADGSRSEDEASDAESLPLLGDDERHLGENGQHRQHDPTVSTGGGAGCSDGPDEIFQPSFGGGGEQEAEDEGEETCDEDYVDEDCSETGTARNRLERGEQSALGSGTPVENRKDQATGVEAARPLKGDRLERRGPAKGVIGSPSSPLPTHSSPPTGGDVADRKTIHFTASGGDAVDMPCAKERSAINLVRPASQTLGAPAANNGEQHQELDAPPAVQTSGTEPAVAMPAGSSSPWLGGSRELSSLASTAPTQRFGVQDRRRTDKDAAVGLEGDGCGDGRGGLRVAETLPQALGVGGDAREQGEEAGPRGTSGNAVVPETSAEIVLLAETLKRNAAESFAGGVRADDDPVVPETLVQSTPVAEVLEGRGSKSLVEGVEGLSASRVQIADSNVARAESREQGREGDGGAAALDEAGIQNVGGEEIRDASGGPAQPADGSQRATLSRAAPLRQGSGNDRGVPHRPLPKGNGGEELSKPKVRDPPDQRLEDDQDEVRETLPSCRASEQVEASREGSKPASALCLATQGSPGQDEPGTDEDGHDENAGRQVPETAAQSVTTQEMQTLSTQEVPETAAQSITTQQIQTLSTQEVPETARAWGSTAECWDNLAVLQVDQSEVVETELLRDGATQSTADCAGAGGDDDNDTKEKREQGATSAKRPPPPSSTLPTEAVVQGAESNRGSAQGRARMGCLGTPDGALASPGSLGPSVAGLHGAAGSGKTPEGAKSPGSGSVKRSSEWATLSPSRVSSAPGSAGKRLRMTPLPPPVDGESRSVMPGAAMGDNGEASPSGLTDDGRSSARKGAREGKQGPPMALRGGSGSGESDSESELPEIDHDLAAVQDAWHAEEGYELGDDGGYADGADEPEESRPHPPPPPKNKVVFNPYAQQAPLDLHAGGGGDDDPCPAGAAGTTKPPPLPPGREASEGCRRPGVATGATSQDRSPRPALRRPSKSTMGFSAATGPADSSLAARLKEQRHHQSSNRILGAGHGHGGTGGVTAAKTPADKSGSWPAYDMGPDTQEVAEVEACLANKRAEKNPRGGTAMESRGVDPIDLDLDEDDDDGDDWEELGNSSRGRGHLNAQGEISAEKKRKRPAAAAAAAAASKGKGPRRPTNPRRVVPSSSRGESRRRQGPVVVLLGCRPRELKRAQLLCKRLRLREPETELVSGATHVVVGSRHTRVSSRSGGGGGGGAGGHCPLGAEEERGTGRHELATHEVKGYREAVMLGLWVLDFSWVEACWGGEGEEEAEAEAGTGDRNKRGKEGARDGRRVAPLSSPAAAPPRTFELLGCSERHEGCEPRRGRYKRGSGAPGVFHGVEFVPVVTETAAAGEPSPSGLELERLRSETERLVRLGGGVVSTSRPPRPETWGYHDNPFGAEDSDAEVVDVDARCSVLSGGRGGGGGGGGRGAAAKAKRVVVLALPDCSDGNGVSQSLAKAAACKRQELGADAAVDRAWVLRSVDEGSPMSCSSYNLSSKRPRGGSSGRAKSRLSIPRGLSSRCEVLLDLENDRGRRMVSAEAVRAQREQTARILERAEEVVEAPIRQRLPPLNPTGLGEDGFDFSRRGSKKAPVKANFTTYAAENKAQRDLIDAMHKGGYLDLDCVEGGNNMYKVDKEKRLGEFWFDYVYDGFFMKRSENAIPEAKRRGCPVDILRAEHEAHASIQTDRSRLCVRKLPGEFPVWKAGRDADDAVELL